MSYDPERYAANKERHAEYGKRYRNKYPEKEKARHRLYKQKNKEKHADLERRRRARKRNLPSDKYTTAQVLELYGAICHICLQEIDLSAERRVGRKGWKMGLHIDHIIEISNGGADTLENVRPAHGLCNLEKNGKHLKRNKE